MSDHGGSSGHDDDDGGGGSPHGSGEHEEGGHGEPWLVSYADLMTLLFGFFVLMYAFAAAKNEDDGDYIRIKRSLAVYFGGNYVSPMVEMESKIKKFMAENPELQKATEITADPDGLKMIITSQVLFASGQANITPEAKPIVEKLVGKIGTDNKDYRIKVEGYTDAVPIHNSSFDSNWELSAGRAIAILKVFEEAGYNPENLSAAGFGATHPSVPNFDPQGEPLPDNQAKNRRVIIRIFPAEPTKPIVVPAVKAVPKGPEEPGFMGSHN